MSRDAWPRTPAELIQAQLAVAAAEPPPWRPAGEIAVGACVVAFPRARSGRGAAGDPAWAAAAIVRGAREVVAEAVVTGAAAAPYEPGLLALREGPLLEAAVRALPAPPDVLLVDATGRDHPRRAGLALHLGAVLDVPTVGVTHRPLLGLEGAGAWLVTRPGARPVAVHAAWRTDVDTAVEVVRAATGRYRTPEPLRIARRLARLARSAT